MMVGACGPPVCVFGIVTLVEARAFDDPTLIDVPLNVEPAGGEAAVWMVRVFSNTKMSLKGESWKES